MDIPTQSAYRVQEFISGRYTSISIGAGLKTP